MKWQQQSSICDRTVRVFLIFCCFLQDSGAFLCVIDDSNEHMLSVWDYKGTKCAEVKVKKSQSSRLSFIEILTIYLYNFLY